MNFFLLFVFLFICIVAYRQYPKTAQPIPVQPKSTIATSMLPDKYVYRQDDERWGTSKIGATSDSMQAYGCTISAVAMAASNLSGEEILPGDLVRRLNEEDGFTDRGWLIWNRLPVATNGRVSAQVYNRPDHRHINRCMADGNYPVVKIYLGGTIVHWVLIVGSTENDYLARDPLHGGPEDPPVRLSERGEDIHSVRCIVAEP